jgi:hypothetical protein
MCTCTSQLADKLGPAVTCNAVRESMLGALARGFHKREPAAATRRNRHSN